MVDVLQHVTVLRDAAVDALSVNAGGVYIDGTYGRGGHSEKIAKQLGSDGSLLVIDKDPVAIADARLRFADDSRMSVFHGSFAALSEALEQNQLPQTFDGLLLDLGVSSPQIDDGARGFSFQRDGALDMRMNPQQGLSAATWIASATESEMLDVLWEYGDERFARRIVRSILETRDEKPLVTTLQLANLISAAVPRKFHSKRHPATKSFQAIRIFINEELADLEKCLEVAVDRLNPGGRLVVISFHSLEDRMVKRYFKKRSSPPVLPRGLPVMDSDVAMPFKTIGKAIKPDAGEVTENVRSRSSVMRILERCA